MRGSVLAGKSPEANLIGDGSWPTAARALSWRAGSVTRKSRNAAAAAGFLEALLMENTLPIDSGYTPAGTAGLVEGSGAQSQVALFPAALPKKGMISVNVQEPLSIMADWPLASFWYRVVNLLVK